MAWQEAGARMSWIALLWSFLFLQLSIVRGFLGPTTSTRHQFDHERLVIPVRRRQTPSWSPFTPRRRLAAPRIAESTQPETTASNAVEANPSLLKDKDVSQAAQAQDFATIPQDDTATHLGAVVVMTLWWYLLSSIEMWQHPSGFMGLPDGITQTMAVYVSVSQLLVYGILYKMASVATLRDAQKLVLAATALCIPADSLVILYDPTGSKVKTVLAFAAVTMCFGVYLCHYLRKAAHREEQPEQYSNISTSSSDDSQHPDIWKTLETYRPPHNIQATHMALEFARSFVAFTVALAAVRDSLGGPVEPWLLASLISIILHTSLEMAITTVFPGVDLEEYPVFVATESALYLVHMVAGSYIAHQSTFGDTVWDHLTYAWLFGNATAKFLGRMKLLLGKIDFDSKLGLSKF